MTSVFQFCNPCNKNQTHSWISSFVIKCSRCGKETKISPRGSVTISERPEEDVPVKKHTPQTHLGLMRTINKAHRDHVNGNY
jgi:ribosomal protein S27E